MKSAWNCIFTTLWVQFAFRRQSLLIILAVLLVTGCVYEPPGPAEIELVERLAQTDTSLSYFSFDLNSSLMIPYLTAFGQNPFNSNIIHRGSDVQFTIPLSPIRPIALVLEIQSIETQSSNDYARVMLNDDDLGFIAISDQPQRKQFTLQPNTWNPSVNQITIHLPEGDTTGIVNQIWLIREPVDALPELETGNVFTGLATFPNEGIWQRGIYLSSGSSLSFPVFLPSEPAFLQFHALPDLSDDLNLSIDVITAGKFGEKYQIDTEIYFRKADRWMPVKWSITDLKGRHAALTFHNNGNTAVLIQDPVITT
jgi:hypothetical protein